MFKKLISNLPFNPSLLGQVSFYSKRLKQEQSVRRMGFMFMALTMFIQMFAVIAPPQQSLAASSREILPGYGASKSEIIRGYNSDAYARAAYAHFGISLADINKMQVSTFNKADEYAAGRRYITAGRAGNGSAGETEVLVNGAPLFKHSIASSYPSYNTIQILRCSAADCGRVKAIILDCGNPMMDLNPPATPTTPAPPANPGTGFLDGSTCTYLWGWGWNGPYARFVHIYVDREAFGGAQSGRDYFEVPANQSRPDVHAQLPGIESEVGYTWNGGPLNNDGKTHKVWVYVTDRGDHYKLLNKANGETVNFNCPAPPPTPTPTPTPPAPTAACDLLQSINSNYQVKTAVNMYARASTTNGATISRYDVDFGDNNGKPEFFTDRDAIKHTYDKTGTYTVVLTVQTSVGARTADTCKKSLTITPTPVACTSNPNIPQTDAKCKPCVENPAVPETDASCVPVIIKHKKVANTTLNDADFNGKTARTKDTLVYTLTTTNVSNKITQKDYVVTESVADIFDYADITDYHGGKFDTTLNTVTWPKENIEAGATVTHQITIRVRDTIPSTNTPTADSGTYDLKMVNVYGDTVTVLLPCATSKCIEVAASVLPNTGPGTSVAIGATFMIIIAYFYYRSRLLGKEVEIIRTEYATGGGF